MTCLRNNEHGADLLIGFLEGTLPEVERVQLAEHAASCRECGELLAVPATLDAYEAPEVSSNFDAALYARIHAAKPRWHFSGWKMAIPAAMAAALAVGVWIQRPEPVQLDEGQKQAAIDPDVRQLEEALQELELMLPVSAVDTL